MFSTLASSWASYPSYAPRYRLADDRLRDFLYDRHYEPWFYRLVGYDLSERRVIEFFMDLHGGESLLPRTQHWTADQRQRTGQELLHKLAADILVHTVNTRPILTKQQELRTNLLRSLELDGYVFQEGRLLLLDTTAVIGTPEILEQDPLIVVHLYQRLKLARGDDFAAYLQLSEAHYLAGEWAESINDSRNVLAVVLQEAAALYSSQIEGVALDTNTYNQPVEVYAYYNGPVNRDSKIGSVKVESDHEYETSFYRRIQGQDRAPNSGRRADH